MFIGIINCIKGCYTVRAEGRFPERALNIASTSGIYVYNVRRASDEVLVFSLSRKGALRLVENDIEGLTLKITHKSGLPVFFKRYRKRAALILLPVLLLAMTSVFSLFIWKVEIIGGNEELQTKVRIVLSENGVYRGALKHKIDHYAVKRSCILAVDDLSWLWVDIKGTTASVKLHERTKKPYLIKINEPSDVIATHSGVIEKMQVYCGQPLFTEGMTVENGQVIVTGIFKSENENIPVYYHHACAEVILRVNESKTVFVPKKTIKKVPTGNKKSVFTLNFKKNNIKFSLNSGISYSDYDKIEKTVKLPFLPVSFSRIEYLEANVVEEPADTDAQIKAHRENFLDELRDKDMQTENVTQSITDTPGGLKVTFNAECIVRTDKEIPIEKGEANGENS